MLFFCFHKGNSIKLNYQCNRYTFSIYELGNTYTAIIELPFRPSAKPLVLKGCFGLVCKTACQRHPSSRYPSIQTYFPYFHGACNEQRSRDTASCWPSQTISQRQVFYFLAKSFVWSVYSCICLLGESESRTCSSHHTFPETTTTN